MNRGEIYSTIQSLQEATTVTLSPSRISIHIPNAKAEMKGCLAALVANPEWLPEYDEVASWMEDNHGRGLLCIGNCGRGKTMMCYRVIPVLINHFQHKVINCYDAVDINAKIDEMKSKMLICVDDIGTESDYLVYGVRRQPFAELVDAAEKRGMLLLLTTNLTTSELQNKYGIRVIDRLRKLTKVIHFKGCSLR